MKLVSKKNGTTTIFPSLISAVARKIGFTPPTGMSATNVQDAIEEVNTRINAHALENVTNLVDYNQTNPFIAPADGIAQIITENSGANGYIVVDGITTLALVGSGWESIVMPIRKGQSMYGVVNQASVMLHYKPYQ